MVRRSSTCQDSQSIHLPDLVRNQGKHNIIPLDLLFSSRASILLKSQHSYLETRLHHKHRHKSPAILPHTLKPATQLRDCTRQGNLGGRSTPHGVFTDHKQQHKSPAIFPHKLKIAAQLCGCTRQGHLGDRSTHHGVLTDHKQQHKSPAISPHTLKLATQLCGCTRQGHSGNSVNSSQYLCRSVFRPDSIWQRLSRRHCLFKQHTTPTCRSKLHPLRLPLTNHTRYVFRLTKKKYPVAPQNIPGPNGLQPFSCLMLTLCSRPAPPMHR